MKTKSTKKGRRILSAALCLLMMITALPMSAFAWTSEEGKRCTSSFGDYYVGSDGEYYRSKATYSFIVYDSKGKHYHDNKANLRLLRQRSDELCREYALSVIEHPSGKKKPYALYQAEKNGMPTRDNVTRQAVDEAISKSFTLKDFDRIMSTNSSVDVCVSWLISVLLSLKSVSKSHE